ncbi:inositol 2-dehydrogenase [Burkholderia sp. SRS-46]|nr:inositol 2-dehydrogenase [Burkholderia sp. SRS-46]
MIEFALFGAGRIGKIHAANLARQPGARLKYVVDMHAPAAQALAHAHGAEAADVERALGDATVQAVVIASSTDTHAGLIVAAANAGKAVFCEKPIDLTVARSRECAEAVRRNGVTCMIGFQRRFDPTFAALKARVERGEIGEPEMLIVTIRARRGLLCQINTSRRAAYGYDQRVELLGSKGMLQAGNVRPTEVTAWSAGGIATDVPEPFFLERYRQAYAAEIAHFVGALRDGAPVRTTIDDGLAALELAEAAMTSWRTGQVVDA